MESNAYSYRYIKKSLRDDIEITKKALEYPYNFDIISNAFKNDEEMVFLVIKKLENGVDFHPIKDIGTDLKNNKDFFIKIISKNPNLFQYASDKLKEDLELLESLLKNLGCKIDYAYTNNKDLIKPQLEIFPSFLKFATKEVLNDRHVILKAIQYKPGYIKYASEEIKNMLGQDKNEFIPKLKKIISIESFAEKLEKDLDKNTDFNLRKNKI